MYIDTCTNFSFTRILCHMIREEHYALNCFWLPNLQLVAGGRVHVLHGFKPKLQSTAATVLPRKIQKKKLAFPDDVWQSHHTTYASLNKFPEYFRVEIQTTRHAPTHQQQLWRPKFPPAPLLRTCSCPKRVRNCGLTCRVLISHDTIAAAAAACAAAALATPSSHHPLSRTSVYTLVGEGKHALHAFLWI